MHKAELSKSGRQRRHAVRDLALAQSVGRLPDGALVGVEEIAAITGLASSSLRKPDQRSRIRMPEPSALGGRHLVWNLGRIRAWIDGGGDGTAAAMESVIGSRPGPGRPTKAEQIARQAAHQAHQ